MLTKKSEEQIIQEFKKRNVRQIIFTIPVVLVMILMGVLVAVYKDMRITSDVLILGIPSTIVAIFIGAMIVALIIASFINWRCPACNTYLGKSINPKFCISCGAKLQKGKYDEVIETGDHTDNGLGTDINGASTYDYARTEHEDSQNMAMAVLGGMVSSVLCAILWAYITYLAGVQIGFMAIGVGLLVGYTTRILGKGVSTPFGIIGGAFSLLGCLMGNILAIVFLVSKVELIPVLEVISYLGIQDIIQILVDTFNPKDLLFYALATYEGYKFSFKQGIK